MPPKAKHAADDQMLDFDAAQAAFNAGKDKKVKRKRLRSGDGQAERQSEKKERAKLKKLEQAKEHVDAEHRRQVILARHKGLVHVWSQLPAPRIVRSDRP